MADNRIHLACNTCDKRILLFRKIGVWSMAYSTWSKGEIDNFLIDHMSHDMRIQTEYPEEPSIPLVG